MSDEHIFGDVFQTLPHLSQITIKNHHFYFALVYNTVIAVTMAKAKRQAIIEELRNLCALHAREILMSTKADGEKSEGQCDLMEKVYHGSAGYASSVDALLQGKGFYESLFFKHDLEVNHQGNEDRKNGVMLEIRPIYHNDEGQYSILIYSGSPKNLISHSKNVHLQEDAT